LSKQTFAEDVSMLPVSETLICILQYLNLTPPVELNGASSEQIFTWAIEHWNLSLIKKQTSISLK